MKLITTKEYLLLIDEEANIKGHKWVYEGNKIIAYYPLTKEAKELDLPLLPNPFDTELSIKLQALDRIGFVPKDLPDYETYMSNEHFGFVKGYEEGYKAAQSKQFSLEDIKEAFNAAREKYTGYRGNVYDSADEYVDELLYNQSLSTQQLPKEFIPEYIEEYACFAETQRDRCFRGSCNCPKENKLKIVNNILQGNYIW